MKEWLDKQHDRIGHDKDQMLEKYLNSRKENEHELERAQHQHRLKRTIRADDAQRIGGATPYFDEVASKENHETEETDLYPHPQNVPITQSDQSQTLRGLKRQVARGPDEYSDEEGQYEEEGEEVDRRGDHADHYDEYERPHRRSPHSARRQRSANHLSGDYDDEEYPDHDEHEYRDEHRYKESVKGRRMYKKKMPSFKVRAGRLSQVDNENDEREEFES